MNYNLDNRLLHGGDYNPDQWLDYPEILADDLRLMKEANINTVTVGVFSWCTIEPREGEYHFEWLDKVFDEMEKINGNVILATPSGGRPQWMSEKYPEVNRTNALGQKQHHGFRHNHCYSSPIYREKVQEINTILAKRYGKRTSLAMWHISNEYSGECFCDHCQDNWRQWLQRKYGTLENLNKAWFMNFWSNAYSSWSQVVAPSPLGESKVHGMDLDWKRFVTDQTIAFFNCEIEPIRRITPNIPVTTNFMAEGHAQNDFIPLEGIDYGKFSKYVDVVSWDSYPDWHNNHEELYQTAMKSAYVHDQYWSLKQQPFLVMESSPSVVNWLALNKSKRPGMHMLSSMQQIAHGSNSTLYFQWRRARGNSEKFHGAVVDHDNSNANRVFKEVSAYGKRLENISQIKGTTKDVKVAIIFDWQSNWALKRDNAFCRSTKRYPQTLQDHYSIFWENDIATDIITSDMSFDKYEVLIAPMLYMITDSVIEKLESFVKNGGTLISSYFTGMVNETDLLYIGGWPKKLIDLFGLKVLETDTYYPDENNYIIYENKTYETKEYNAIIELIGAKELARYTKDFYQDTPAITVNNYGRGKAFFIAPRTKCDFLDDFYKKIIEENHLYNDLITKGNKEVSIQMRKDNVQKYYFVMNFANHDNQIVLSRVITDMETNNKISGELNLKPFEVKILKE
ncbi:MAG: beta-galactosidase [Coprobacillus sp.]